ncbi:hypothetical protein FE251_07110 [Georgenia wutianyii]|uniref:Trp biosynthesis-associated membrane protein n=1 Tax=Georgenia wutianyii TaxID=2585135 RepID=A0ABX5VL19_9MICO|nr:Trp biosynthesis-associated membrane protein [Georgenia wutianyii]QDB79167.1 hypothetical protein FE251_07110 [Georgenia wutianyii]
MSRGRVVLAVLVLGVLGFALSALTWGSTEVPTVLAQRTVTVSGGDASPVTTAASLAVLATGLALALGGRWVTRVCAGALVVLGGALGAAAIGFLRDPRPRLETAAAQVSGVRETLGTPEVTAWPYLTIALGALVAAAAVLVVRIPTVQAGRRFERTAGQDAAGDPERDERVRAMDDWDALGRGEDPTARDHG